MVYSTCSFSEEQNEEVVQWLLDQHQSEASVVPLSFEVDISANPSPNALGLIRQGSIPGTIRFIPPVVDNKSMGGAATTSESKITQNLCGGGFFLAKIKKLL